MSTLKKVLGAVVGLGVLGVGGFAAVVAMQPAEQHIERSRVMAASAGDIFPYAEDFRGFVKWHPWQEMDPEQVVAFSEPSAGVGAWYTWEGNDDVGKGRMEHLAVGRDVKVTSKLQFIEPFASTADVTFSLAPTEGGTKVTWAFDSQNDFMGKAFGLFVDMDAMLGKDFERGLDNLARLAETDATGRIAREAAEAEAAAAAAAAEAAAAEADAATAEAVVAP